ncbi:MAG: alcohol dehydrogenase catalytic domain-containing protein, partial [Acidobacteriota bacterium]
MTYAIRFHATGGPEVLNWEEVPVLAPGPGEALVRHTAVGLNFIDTYHRSGLYPLPLPSGLGLEAAGVVEEVGEGVREVAVGQRVAYAGGPPGAYSQRRVMPAHRLVPLPETIDDVTAAAVMVKGLTAWFLLRRTYRVQAGETILFHAA